MKTFTHMTVTVMRDNDKRKFYKIHILHTPIVYLIYEAPSILEAKLYADWLYTRFHKDTGHYYYYKKNIHPG
jgi:hypothetical protein